ncbi:MAG: hypothetical protein HQK62_11695 [Desulfamplus sp.]|nr:hypothetical protein [Desulfamplus sp.]
MISKNIWKTHTHEQVPSSGDESPLLRPERFGSNLPYIIPPVSVNATQEVSVGNTSETAAGGESLERSSGVTDAIQQEVASPDNTSESASSPPSILKWRSTLTSATQEVSPDNTSEIAGSVPSNKKITKDSEAVKLLENKKAQNLLRNNARGNEPSFEQAHDLSLTKATGQEPVLEEAHLLPRNIAVSGKPFDHLSESMPCKLHPLTIRPKTPTVRRANLRANPESRDLILR